MQGGGDLAQGVKAALKEGGVPKFGDKGQRVFTSVATKDELDLLRNWAVLARAKPPCVCLPRPRTLLPVAPPYRDASPADPAPASVVEVSVVLQPNPLNVSPPLLMRTLRLDTALLTQARKAHIPHVSVIALDAEVAAAAERMGLIVFSAPKLLASVSDAKENARVAKARLTPLPSASRSALLLALCSLHAPARVGPLVLENSTSDGASLCWFGVPLSGSPQTNTTQAAIISAIVSAGHDVLLSEPDVVRPGTARIVLPHRTLPLLLRQPTWSCLDGVGDYVCVSVPPVRRRGSATRPCTCPSMTWCAAEPQRSQTSKSKSKAAEGALFLPE